MKKPVLILLILVSGGVLFSQDFERLTDSYLGVNAEGFTQPAVDIFSGMVNTGLHNEVSIRDSFYFKLDFIASAAFISDDQKTFIAKTDPDFRPYQEVEVPTIVGLNESISIQGDSGATYVFPGGLGINYVPTVAPQIIVGGIFGTELMVRFLTLDIKDKIGKLQFFGIGVRHNIGQYFANNALDVSLGYYYQNFKVASYLNNTNHYFELAAGKTFGILDLSAMIGYQASDMRVTYTSGEEEDNVDFTLDAKSPLRFGLGVGLDFGLLHLSFEGHYANQLVGTAVLGFTF